MTREYELADVGERFIASIIDNILLGVITGALFGAAGGGGGLVGWLIALGYNWYFWTRNDGQTPGKSIMKIRVIKTTGAPMTDGDAVLRYIGYHISGIVMGLGYIWALFDSNHQAWHDKIANTYVVKAVPVSEKSKNEDYYDKAKNDA